MAVLVFCEDPSGLLKRIKKAIADERITTWQEDGAGDFTHIPEQWRYRAWMRPRIVEGRITFNIVASKNEKMSKTVYGVYHGRFIEMLLTHFDHDFSKVQATALATFEDIV
ncbi:MAG: hypothetical protein ACYCXX_15615 [Acidiferrobacter thiooxydans]